MTEPEPTDADALEYIQLKMGNHGVSIAKTLFNQGQCWKNRSFWLELESRLIIQHPSNSKAA